MKASRLLLAAFYSAACGAEPGAPPTDIDTPALAANVDASATGFSLLPDLVVIAAGRPQPSAEVVGDVSVIERSEVERLQAQNLSDCLLYIEDDGSTTYAKTGERLDTSAKAAEVMRRDCMKSGATIAASARVKARALEDVKTFLKGKLL